MERPSQSVNKHLLSIYFEPNTFVAVRAEWQTKRVRPLPSGGLQGQGCGWLIRNIGSGEESLQLCQPN